MNSPHSVTKQQMYDAVIKVLVDGIVEAFINSDHTIYPLIINIPDLIFLEIRVPCAPPAFFFEKVGARASVKRFPAIEEIYLSPKIQGCGLFSMLAQALANTNDVIAVVVSNVANKAFSEALSRKCFDNSSNWTVYKTGLLPSFALWRKFEDAEAHRRGEYDRQWSATINLSGRSR